MTPAQIAALATLAFRGLLIVVLIVVVLRGCGKLEDLAAGPYKAEAAASRGNLEAAKDAATHQNVSISGRAAAGKARQERSAKAVAEAGKPQLKRAEEIASTPAPGSTPTERAINRINAEMGQ